jgi:hypothetical protein
MTDGEVAVRQNGQEHAVGTDELDGEQILADLDGDPVVHVPTEVGVFYHDKDDDLATDGAGYERQEVEMRGFGLSEDFAAGSMILSVVLLYGAGSMIAGSSNAIGLAMLAGGAALGYIGARSYWSGRS